MKEKGSQKGPPSTTSVPNEATANVAEENQAYDARNSQSSDAPSVTSTPRLTQYAQVLIANSMNLVTDNDVAKDLICDVIDACNDL